MNAEKKDRLDQEIDEVLAALAGEEPQRVSAASVRRALDVSRPSRLPVWFAAAAVLIVAFGVWMKGRSAAPIAPASIAEAPRLLEPARTGQPFAVPNVIEGASTPSSRTPRVKPVATQDPAESSYEGLPGIVIATIEQPVPLTTSPIAAEALVISPIEIPALSVPTLSHGPQQQEKPQP